MNGFPSRSIHLDFHTSPLIPDVGADFDPREFARTMAAANVQSVTVFAKCHHGRLYYDTDRSERHPGLKPGLDLLGEQIDALHSVGIRAPIYLSVQIDEEAARAHPEWIVLDGELRLHRRGGTAFSAKPHQWNVLDMSSPYLDYMTEQLEDVLRTFAPVDGIFLDMCWDQPSCSPWAVDAMRAAGLDPTSHPDRIRHAAHVSRDYRQRFTDLILRALHADAAHGVWFNSRPKAALIDEANQLRHIEIEALPTGGWGYDTLPYVGRLVKTLNLPTVAMTGRFHESWGDSGGLKPLAALRYETAQAVTLGLKVSIGDSLHPRGVLSPAVYERIGEVYRHVRRCQEVFHGTDRVVELGLLSDPAQGDTPGPSISGAVRMLQQLKIQFDVVGPHTDWDAYRAMLVPESTVVDRELAAALHKFHERGGAVVLVGAALLTDTGEPTLPDLPLRELQPADPGTVFMIVDPKLGLPAHPLAIHGPWISASAREEADVLATIRHPYFPRSWEHFSGHSYTPVDLEADRSEIAAATHGRIAAITGSLLTNYAEHGNDEYRELLGRTLDAVLPDRLLTTPGPIHLETGIASSDDKTVVSLISYLPARQTERLDLVHDPFPIVDLPVTIRTSRDVHSASLEPEGTPLTYSTEGTTVTVPVTVTDGHALIVLTH